MARTIHSTREWLILAVAALLATGLSLRLVSAIAEEQDHHEPQKLRYGILDPPLVLEHDITIRTKTSIHPLDPAPKPLECSSVCWVQGKLFLTSDRHEHVLFSMPLELDSATLAPGLPEPIPVITTERRLLDDAEALTSRRHDGRTRLSAQVADEVRHHFPDLVLRTTVPRSVRISEAPSHAQTVMTYDPSSSGALSYADAARELALRAPQRAD